MNRIINYLCFMKKLQNITYKAFKVFLLLVIGLMLYKVYQLFGILAIVLFIVVLILLFAFIIIFFALNSVNRADGIAERAEEELILKEQLKNMLEEKQEKNGKE